MAKNITRDEVVKAVQQGILLAQKDYKRSAEDWISNAPEYLSTVMVFRSILGKLRKLDNYRTGYMTLECKQDNIVTIIKRGRKYNRPPLSNRSRVDLLLWTGSGNPRAVIEIKRDYQNWSGTANDIKRIREYLRWGTPKIGFGIFATIVYKDLKLGKTNQETEDAVWDEIYEVEQEVGRRATSLTWRPHSLAPQPLTYHDNGKTYTRYWCPLCFTFSRKKKPRKKQ